MDKVNSKGLLKKRTKEQENFENNRKKDFTARFFTLHCRSFFRI